MIIANDKSWLFISTMKCATMSMYNCLPKIGGKKIGNGWHNRTDKRLAKFHFTICRNPYDRAVSIWFSTCMRDKDRYGARSLIKSNGGDYTNFKDFARIKLATAEKADYLFTSQSNWHNGLLIDKYLKLENLKTELNSIGISIDVPKLNYSEDRKDDWRYYMDEKTIEILNKWAGNDFSLGYERL